jgi:hypothetical protein
MKKLQEEAKTQHRP